MLLWRQMKKQKNVPWIRKEWARTSPRGEGTLGAGACTELTAEAEDTDRLGCRRICFLWTQPCRPGGQLWPHWSNEWSEPLKEAPRGRGERTRTGLPAQKIIEETSVQEGRAVCIILRQKTVWPVSRGWKYLYNHVNMENRVKYSLKGSCRGDGQNTSPKLNAYNQPDISDRDRAKSQTTQRKIREEKLHIFKKGGKKLKL